MEIDVVSLIIGLIAGIVISIGGMMIKRKMFGSEFDDSTQNAINEANALRNENEKLHRRIKEVENQNEDLIKENQKLSQKFKEKGEDQEDLQDELAKAKAEIKKLLIQNDELSHKTDELKSACQSYERRINEITKSERDGIF